MSPPSDQPRLARPSRPRARAARARAPWPGPRPCARARRSARPRVRPRSVCTWGKSPGELPDWKRVGPAKAAEMLGPAITQEADAGLHARGFAPRTDWSANPVFLVQYERITEGLRKA